MADASDDKNSLLAHALPSDKVGRGYIGRLRREGYKVKRWNAFVEKPIYYVEGADSELEAFEQIEKAVQGMNMQETAVEAVKHFPYSHGRSIVEFLRDFDVKDKEGNPLVWNEFEWYKAVTGAYESGKLDGVLTEEQRQLLMEAKLGAVTDENMQVLDPERLVNLQLLTPMGRGVYSYGICNYLNHVLLPGFPMENVAESSLDKLDERQRRELGDLGLIEENEGAVKITSLGREVFDYLGSCPIDVTMDRESTIHRMAKFWYNKANKESDPETRVDLFLKAARIAAKKRNKTEDDTVGVMNKALESAETPEQLYRIMETDAKLNYSPEDGFSSSIINRALDRLSGLDDEHKIPRSEIGAFCAKIGLFKKAAVIYESVYMVDEAVSSYLKAEDPVDAATLLWNNGRKEEAYGIAEDGKALAPFFWNLRRRMTNEEVMHLVALAGDFDYAARYEALTDWTEANDGALGPEAVRAKIKKLREFGVPVSAYEDFFTPEFAPKPEKQVILIGL